MTHFPERSSQLHSSVATACHLKLTTCFITQSLVMHSGSLAQGDALAPRYTFLRDILFYTVNDSLNPTKKPTTRLAVYV